MALSSDELNYLIYRYLQESGFSHSAFAFACESLVAKASFSGGDKPPEMPGALISFVQNSCNISRPKHPFKVARGQTQMVPLPSRCCIGMLQRSLKTRKKTRPWTSSPCPSPWFGRPHRRCVFGRLESKEERNFKRIRRRHHEPVESQRRRLQR